MTLRLAGCLAVAAIVCAAPVDAKTTESAGTAVAIALPIAAGALTVYKDDWKGTAQLVVSTALTVGTVYGLKHLVRECRPFAEPCAKGGPNWDSFPSDTSALAFAPAQFLWQRYGWQYGLPAYGAATFVGWTRVDAQKHHWYDVATSFGVSLLYNEIITTRFQRRTGFYTNLDAQPNGVYASVNYRW